MLISYINIKIDWKYIISIAIISLVFSLLPHLRILVYRPQTAYLRLSPDNKTVILDTMPKNGDYKIVWKKRSGMGHRKNAMSDTTLNKRTVEVVLNDDNRSYLMAQESFREICIQLSCSFLYIFLLFIINYPVARPSDKFAKLKAKKVILSVILTLATAYILSLGFNVLLHKLLPNTPFIVKYFGNPVSSFVFSMVILAASYYGRANYQRRHFELENEKLKRESLQTQFESLKNQVSPHFLFNSLNALQTLIREAPQTAQQYVNHLSSVLRYTLQSNEKETVPLEDEMNFVDSYIFLLKLRYEPNLMIKTIISEKYLNYKLPPLTVQTLIENAVKHNEISKRNPLTITITTDPFGVLIVTNNLRKKLTTEPGTGIGLSNLSQQYKLLAGKDITIKQGSTEFTVEVPLLNP